MAVFEVRRGSSPVILAFPHTGTEVPADISARLNIGTNGGMACDARVEKAVADVARAAAGYSSILNGR